jgi:hypothetical protein
LELSLQEDFVDLITEELRKKKYRNKFVRVHDGGDFYDADYLLKWLEIAERFPDITFYSYTKQVSMLKKYMTHGIVHWGPQGRVVIPFPDNYKIIFSLGGREDHLIDKEVDRHSDVFPTVESLESAGYFQLGSDDKDAVLNANHKVGLLRNNIPHLVKKQGQETFSTLQNKVQLKS